MYVLLWETPISGNPVSESYLTSDFWNLLNHPYVLSEYLLVLRCVKGGRERLSELATYILVIESQE